MPLDWRGHYHLTSQWEVQGLSLLAAELFEFYFCKVTRREHMI